MVITFTYDDIYWLTQIQYQDQSTVDYEWTKWFYGPEGTVGIGPISVSGILFENDHITPTITGWGIGVGVGVGFGAAWSQTYYTRVFDWVMPPLLKRISVPE
jgi:hypothetical protein